MNKKILTAGLCTILINFFSAGILFPQSMTQKWMAGFNGTSYSANARTLSVSADDAGNIYFTGAGNDSPDFYTVKYNPEGVQLWTAKYDGPGNSEDVPGSIAVSKTGSVYVAGDSYGSGTSSDFTTVKYNPEGIQQWVARYDGPKNDNDVASSVALDSSGNVYVTGYCKGKASGFDFTTIKYDSSGKQLWKATYNGPGNDDDIAKYITVSASGDIFVSGYSVGSGSSHDYAVIKCDSDGRQQWVARYNGPGNGQDETSAIITDEAGNVYVTGYSKGTGTELDYCTIKYNAAGVLQWTARYNGKGNMEDAAYSIALDGAGSVYVTGISYTGKKTGQDYVTVKYSSAGVQEWTAVYNGSGNGPDFAKSMTIDNNGNVCVTGFSEGIGSSADFTTLIYNSAGVLQSETRYKGASKSEDFAYDILADSSGNIYVAGFSVNSKADGKKNAKYVLIKYSK